MSDKLELAIRLTEEGWILRNDLALAMVAAMKEAHEALWEVEELIQQLPMGCDEEADPEDASPADACAHLGGLILQRVRKALEPKR